MCFCCRIARVLIPRKGGAVLKKLFESKEEKITEKAFTHGLVISVLSIILCLIALGSTTYAWFGVDTSSGNNVIESGRFALEISVEDIDGNAVTVSDNGNGKYSCIFESVGVYTVVISMADDSTATKGYCDVTFGTSAKKHTSLVSRDPSLGVDPLTFTVEIATAGLTVGFTPKWGIPAHADIFDGDAISEVGEVIVSEDNA